MSGRERKPGDVAMRVSPRGEESLAVCVAKCTNHAAGWHWHTIARDGRADWDTLAHPSVTYHPLVVIDPEDREQVERLGGLILRLRCRCGRLWLQESPRCEWHDSRHDRAVESRSQGSFEDLADALREFANPTPPKPDEPTGWLAAVEEPGEDRRWYRDGEPNESHPWRQVRTDGVHVRNTWAELPRTVRVLSEGVTA